MDSFVGRQIDREKGEGEQEYVRIVYERNKRDREYI